MKTCAKCNTTKPVDKFGPNRKLSDKLDRFCRSCRTLYDREAVERRAGRPPLTVQSLNMTDSAGRGKLKGARTLLRRAFQDVVDAWPAYNRSEDHARYFKHNMAMAIHSLDIMLKEQSDGQDTSDF